MEKNDYVRLVRDKEGTIIDSFDANPEFEALKIALETERQHVKDLQELLSNTRRIAVELDEAVVARLRRNDHL